MSDKHESPSMAGRCRICLIAHGCMTSLQSDRVEAKLKDLTKCTCIDIKYEENLPGVVCHVCLYKLNMWSEFKEQFIQSNKVLLEQLEISEVSDNTIKDSSKDKSCTTKNGNVGKRKRKSGEDTVSDTEKKKSKLDVPSSEVANITCDSIISDTIYISSDENDKSSSSKPKKNANNGEESAESKMYSGPRARLLPARRGRNIERRKASTKRWVERKKALIASIGETVSDTDSIASDDVQLSPVQKARAKTNADKELERQKKMAKVLKNLETNLTEKYIAFRDKDTDSDTRRTRLSKEAHSNTLQQRDKNSLLNQIGKKSIIEKYGSSLDSSMERDNSPTPLMNDVTLDGHARNFNVQADEEAFTPHSVQSEIVVDDVTYAVTSTLILTADSSNYDKMDLYNLMKDSKSLSPDESNRQKNTDIIKAVNLCPVPNANKSNSKFRKSKSDIKFVERCMKIEVEGNELSLLKRLQFELADFVEKEMKHKLFDTSDGVAKTNNTDSAITGNTSYLYQNLSKTLRSMIESNIKKNIESSIVSQVNDACGQGSTKISPMLAKMVANLSRYQPKIMLKRLDIAKENKHYNINNAHVLMPVTSRGKLAGPFSAITRKRQSILPVRYGDYSVSTLDSDSDAPDNDDDDYDEDAIQETPKTTKSRTFNMVTRQSTVVTDKPKENKQNEQKGNYAESIKIEGAIAENHICGVCGLTFPTRKDVEIHVRTHKITACTVVLSNENVTSPQKPLSGKQKMKRCKRCHEIVEARFVKSHVCKTALHKCYVCDSMFRTKNLLAKHLESHDHSEFNIVNAIENKKFNNADTLLKIISVASTSPQKDQAQETETTVKTPTDVNDKNDIQSDKISSTGVKLDSAENVRKPKETYTCFVCDKIFTDEEILKDHLQKHCDDLSEGEQSNSKEQYQCAICGNILESDQALEEHVSKHLFDDEDDNPNLISIDENNDNKDNKDNNKSKESETYQCGQCSETFDSEMLLEMHMQAHEEEIAIAEWERQGMKDYQYQCSLCDELCDTEEELAEHLDIHNANAQVCQLCDKPFRTLEDLQEHVATH